MGTESVTDTSCVNSGDTSWVLLSTILVLGMMPALAFFEAGLLRKKNTISILTQIFSGVFILSTMWQIFGYSLTYSEDYGGVIGGLDKVFLLDLPFNACNTFAPSIPEVAFAAFQCMFACITPLLMTGAYAERFTWRAFLVFTIIWEILVYYPLAHWIWGGGWLYKMKVIDFAGGIVIHTSAGAAALVLALVLGRRKGFEKVKGEFPPHSIPLATLGGCLLWMGWFGFNAGSSYSSGALASNTVMVTQMASATSGVVWMLAGWAHMKRPCIVHIINGGIAGLAGVTPASGYITVQSAFILGLILGLSSYGSLCLLKHKLKIDDALDVSSVHGVTGIIGSLAIGICATTGVNPGGQNGWVYGNPRQLGIQTLGVVVAFFYSGVLTAIILFVMKKVMKVQLTPEEEELGLDQYEYEGDSYDFGFELGAKEETVTKVEHTFTEDMTIGILQHDQLKGNNYHHM